MIKLLLIITLADPKQLTPQDKLIIYARAFFKFYN